MCNIIIGTPISNKLDNGKYQISVVPMECEDIHEHLNEDKILLIVTSLGVIAVKKA